MMRAYIVKGHFQPFWYKHHATLDLSGHLRTLVLMNIGIQWGN